MIKWIIGISTTLLILILLSIALLITPVGTKVSLQIAKKVLPGKLHYQKVSGIIIGPLKLKNLTYQYKQTSISIKEFYIQWEALKLLLGEFDIEDLKADNVKITLPKDSKKSQFSLPNIKLPVAVKIDKATFNNIQINNMIKQRSIQLKMLSLQGEISNEHLNTAIVAHFTQPYAVTAKLDIQGTTKQFRFKMLADSKDIHWKVDGYGGKQWLVMSTDQSHTLNGSLKGNLKLQWNKTLRWQANLDTKNLNLQKFYKNLPKQISIKLISKGEWKNKQPIFSINSTIQAPGALVQLNGSHDQQWDLKWKIAITKLSSLIGNYKGSLEGSGKILGPTQTPLITGVLNGKKLLLSDYNIANLNAKWNVDLSYHHSSSIQLIAKSVEASHLQLSEVDLQATGKPDIHQLKAHATINNKNTGLININVLLDGKIENKTWKGQLKQFTTDSTHFGKWVLDQPGLISYSTNAVTFTPLCWHSTKGATCIKGAWHANKPWEITVNSEGLNLSPFLALLKMKVNLDNPSTLAIQIKGKGLNVQKAQATIDFGKGLISYPINTKKFHAKLTDGKLIATLNQKGLNTKLELELVKEDNLTVNLNFPGYSIPKKISKNQPVKGSIKINMSRLKFISLLLPEITKATGKITSNFNISGTIGNPSANGKIKLQNGSIHIPELNLTLNKITIDLNATDNVLHYKLQAYSQNKLIQLNGTTQFKQPGRTTEISLQGDNILIINTQEYEIYLSPKLQATIKGREIDVKGSITIPKALLKPIDFASAKTLPQDVVFVGPAAEKSSLWTVTLNVDIILGKNVIVDTHGFYGNLSGKLSINKTPTHFYLATGKITATNATFSKMGKVFIISPTSNVSYKKSPLDDPNLNIKASRTIKLVPGTASQFKTLRSLTVGLNIEGTFQKPNVSLFSIPSTLSQADILSYLIFGHPANANTPGNISLLLQTVDTLNLGGGDTTPGGIGDKIAQGLGLSEFGIESGTSLNLLGSQQESAFVVGRYVSPNIYVRYSRGLVIPINIFEARYLIGQHWAIQTNSSELGTGADILYTIQTN